MYPLFFSFQDVVSGNGFLAGVAVRGRVLMVREDDGAWWLYGVEPGAIAASGETPQEVYANLHAAFKSVLFDIAAEASTYHQFKEAVERFFNEVDAAEEARWTEARTAIRSGALVPEQPISALPKESKQARGRMAVERLDEQARKFSPKDNVLETFATAA